MSNSIDQDRHRADIESQSHTAETVLQDPWACYEDDDAPCGSAQIAESDSSETDDESGGCCCCC